MALIKCKECGEEVSAQAKTCPHCGVKNPGVSAKSGCLGFIGLCFVVAVVMALFGDPEPVNKANEQLTLMYIDREIYTPVDCETQKVNEEYYIRCAPAGSSVTGGLYLVKLYDEDRYQIYTVNGPASQHARGTLPRLEENRDIPAILEKF